MMIKTKCPQCSEETYYLEDITIFGTTFTICPYCCEDAYQIFAEQARWSRDDEDTQPKFSRHGYAIVFDGNKEIYRRGFGLADHG